MEDKTPHANGTLSDPREQKTWDIYVTKLSQGIDNAYQSAIEGGYEESTAKNITLTGWYKERKADLIRKGIFSKAEKVIEKTLDYKTEEEDEETGKTKVNTSLLSIQSNVALTVAKSLGKKYYSDRLEHTGADGKDIITPVIIFKDYGTDNQQQV